MQSCRYADCRDKCFTLNQPHLWYFAHIDFIICPDLDEIPPLSPPCKVRLILILSILIRSRARMTRKFLQLPACGSERDFCLKIAIQQEVKLINRKCNNRNNVLPTFTFENRRVPGSLMTACYAKFHLNCFYIFTQMIY